MHSVQHLQKIHKNTSRDAGVLHITNESLSLEVMVMCEAVLFQGAKSQMSGFRAN